MNHAGIARIGKDYADKEILYEMKYGVVDTSNCDNILRVSPHHNGALEQHGRVSAMLKKEAGLGYYDGPYKSVPFVGCRVLPLNVVVRANFVYFFIIKTQNAVNTQSPRLTKSVRTPHQPVRTLRTRPSLSPLRIPLQPTRLLQILPPQARSLRTRPLLWLLRMPPQAT